MRFKFAHAVSIAAAVAMATACGKKDEGGASTAGIGGQFRGESCCAGADARK